MKQIETQRDLCILFDGRQCLVTAVDSCGGIGEKPGDALFCPYEAVGLHTARVALLEVLAAGASPVMVSLAACNDPEVAEKMLRGVRQVFQGFDKVHWVISTEKNMQTSMTALGVTVTGVCPENTLRISRSCAGDLLYLAGLPLVGEEVLSASGSMFQPASMAGLLGNALVGSVLPVGSRGVAAEAGVLARESSLEAMLADGCGIDFKKSAGPSTCVLFSARPGSLGALDVPELRMVGRLVSQ